MKSIRNILIAIFLGLLLAGGTWQVALAPQNDANILTDKEPGITGVSESTPPPVSKNTFVEKRTVVPEKLATIPTIDSTTVTPDTEADSCSNGPIGSGVFVWPTDNHSLSGKDYGPGHPGIDIAAGEGSPVYAVDAGVVVAEGDDVNGYGNVIQIDHGNGYLTVYAHLSVIGVRICDGVEAGQWIGAAGSTGNARGAHLHFEVARDGRYINPWDVLPKN
jgi:murein DD-endopeptidase MepM/ murein hydrolase activator NlpD